MEGPLARMRSRASGASEGEDTTGRDDSSFGGDLWRGPVGMILVVELGLHGVRSTLVDRAPADDSIPEGGADGRTQYGTAGSSRSRRGNPWSLLSSMLMSSTNRSALLSSEAMKPRFSSPLNQILRILTGHSWHVDPPPRHVIEFTSELVSATEVVDDAWPIQCRRLHLARLPIERKRRRPSESRGVEELPWRSIRR